MALTQDILSHDGARGRLSTCSFEYLARDDLYEKQKPYYFSGVLPDEQEKDRTNLRWERHEAPLKNMRGLEHGLNFDQHGFKLYLQPTNANLIEPSQNDLKQYMEEMSSWLKTKLNAEHVLCFNYRARTRKTELNFRAPDSVGTFKNTDLPQTNPHVDQSREAGPRRARRHMTEQECGKYMNDKWRLRLVNVWRPIAYPVEDCPLAMCDYHSIDEADLQGCDRASREYVGEVNFLRYNSNQKWFWFSDQTPDEILVFVNYDSNPGSSPPFTPHSAFVSSAASSSARPRQSIECAFIVITENS